MEKVVCRGNGVSRVYEDLNEQEERDSPLPLVHTKPSWPIKDWHLGIKTEKTAKTAKTEHRQAQHDSSQTPSRQQLFPLTPQSDSTPMPPEITVDCQDMQCLLMVCVGIPCFLDRPKYHEVPRCTSQPLPTWNFHPILGLRTVSTLPARNETQCLHNRPVNGLSGSLLISSKCWVVIL